MAFAHQYSHAGTALQGSQVMLSSKTPHSPTSPSTIEQTRALLHESGLPLLHFLPRMNALADGVYAQGPLTTNGLGVEPSAFYSMGSPPGHFPVSPEQWKGLAGQGPGVYPFDPMLAVHPYASFYGGLDLNNAARRKNATRETTSALKAWLYEHRKNPYPTKGEKIMLAIITKMTLTQVSTWFANARRRLKKESKSGWNGKDRDLDDSDFETDGEDRTNENEDEPRLASETDDEDIDVKVTSDLSDISDEETDESKRNSTECRSRLSLTSDSPTNSTPSNINESRQNTSTSANEGNTQRNSVVISPNTKPKIWSIDEIMNKDTPKARSTTHEHQTHYFLEDRPNTFNNHNDQIHSSTLNITNTNTGVKDQTAKVISKQRTETISSSSDTLKSS